MELMFESRIELTRTEGRIYAFQEKPELLTEPVITPEGEVDGNRVQIGTVLKDGGTYRMWYRVFPEGGRKSGMSAYAESEDGITWKKPALNIVKGVPFDNNYIDMSITSVYYDPQATGPYKYYGVGYLNCLRQTWAGSGEDPQGVMGCFHTAQSKDGIHWEADIPEPRWFSGDTIHCAYHPVRKCGMVTIKYVRRHNDIHRRAIWIDEKHGDQWNGPVCALMPDEFDDTVAVAKGFNSTDYYEMGMLGTGQGTVGFLNNFRHRLPLSTVPGNYAIFGTSDISLVYQAHSGDRWLHSPGRKSFINGAEVPWNRGWTGPASTVVDIGDCQGLYLTGHDLEHAWHMNVNWKTNEKWQQIREESGPHSVIGLARWPRWRLFGLQAVPEGWIDLEIGSPKHLSELALNYKTGPQGCIKVQVYSRKGRGDCGDLEGCSEKENVIPLTGDSLQEVVCWKNGSTIPVQKDRCLVARITMENAALYGWELREING